MVEKVKAARQRAPADIFPPPELVNRVYSMPIDDVRVVILGQDPYHGRMQANGLAFSVNKKAYKFPPSLKNILKEVRSCYPDARIPDYYGDLSHWEKQGVFLLNTILTVEFKKPLAHKGWGWELVTDATIKAINEHCNNVVFLLWGRQAASKAKLIDPDRHLVLKSVHPSPLSADRGFFGCKHFLLANEYLKKHGHDPIDWSVIPPEDTTNGSQRLQPKHIDKSLSKRKQRYPKHEEGDQLDGDEVYSSSEEEQEQDATAMEESHATEAAAGSEEEATESESGEEEEESEDEDNAPPGPTESQVTRQRIGEMEERFMQNIDMPTQGKELSEIAEDNEEESDEADESDESDEDDDEDVNHSEKRQRVM